MRRFFKTDHLLATLLAFLLMALLPWILEIAPLKAFKDTFDDLQVTDIAFSKLRQQEYLPACTNIVVVNIENLSRPQTAALIYLIGTYSPKVIGIDKIFKKSEGSELDNNLLSQAIESCPDIVMKADLEQYSVESGDFKKIHKSDIGSDNNISIGYTNFFRKESKDYFTVRSFYPESKIKNQKYSSFALKIVEKYNPEAAKIIINRGHEKETINYKGGYDKFFYESGENVLSGNINPELFQGRIILLGNAAIMTEQAQLADLYFTPLCSDYTGRTLPDMFEVLVHANIIAMILEGNFFTVLPSFIGFVFAFLICYINMVIFDFISERYKKWYELTSLLIFVAESLLILIATVYLFLVFKLEVKLTVALFISALSLIVFDGYTYSLKPMGIKLYYKFFRR